MNNANHETCKYTQTAKHIKNIQLIEWTMTKDEQMKDAGDTKHKHKYVHQQKYTCKKHTYTYTHIPTNRKHKPLATPAVQTRKHTRTQPTKTHTYIYKNKSREDIYIKTARHTMIEWTYLGMKNER